MRLHPILFLLLLGSGDAPPKPATTKWEGPEVRGLFSNIKTTIYYGPWKCSQRWMSECEKTCSTQGYTLMGCMWLADVKFDGQGLIPLLSMEVQGGTRYAVTHCCCNYSTLPPEVSAQRRKEWSRQRQSFREKWARNMGAWPTDEKGNAWEGHHIHDLHHGGHPTEGKNLLPIPENVHDVLDKQYPQCYASEGAWKQIGPDRPYSD